VLYKISDSNFHNHAIELFRYQAVHNEVYNAYLKELKISPLSIQSLEEIPFLPIEFFKMQKVKTGEWQEKSVFESSGTTQSSTSKHYINDLDAYHSNALQLFQDYFGPVSDKTIIGLLPSYLERSNSSLVSMVNSFIEISNSPLSGFYLNNIDELISVLHKTTAKDNIILFGVSFALLDLALAYEKDLSHIKIIETGGMKGRRPEIVKDELYEIINKKLKGPQIYSEYGMTELLSQAYGLNGIFQMSDKLKIMIRDVNDPFSFLPREKTGGINVIDLANEHSCAFIETKDLGRINADGSFEVLGRFDNSDIRGCNLMVS
jgi:phenylacetate-coenzyme A ligase PaaK-like adenylate-forming protein